MNKIITDSGFWFALYDKRDQHHARANELVEYLELGKIIMPFPTLYESMNTRFSKRKEWMLEFERILNLDNINLVDDGEYKLEALSHSFSSTLQHGRPISLVDCVIRLMLEDPTLRPNYLLSFNIGDFKDVCSRRNIEILV